MTQMTNDHAAPNEEKLKGWHVLMIMLGFFGVVFAVNGVFLYNAITSFPGEDVKKSYVQGLNYNQTLAARAAQIDMGWSAAAGIEGEEVVFQLTDAKAQPVSGRVVIAELRRRASANHDQTLALTALSEGEYTASVGKLDKGEWELRFTVMEKDAETVAFTANKTLILK